MITQKKMSFECETVTPMFLSGADGRSAEFRPPSVKGALRFWWRAMHGNMNCEELHKKESAIFGSTNNKSAFTLRIAYDKERIISVKHQFPENKDYKILVERSSGKKFNIDILYYLAYGTYEFGKRDFQRSYLPAGTQFNVDLYIPEHNSNITEELVKTFYYLSICGGLGAKSRNGFGGVRIPYHAGSNLYPIADDAAFQDFTCSSSELSYTALSKDIQIFSLEKSFDSWHACLAQLGKIYRKSRLELNDKYKYHHRRYIGGPIQQDKNGFLERNSKTHFLRVQKKDKEKYTGYIIYLPLHFCKNIEKDKYNKTINTAEVNRSYNISCGLFNEKLRANFIEVNNA